MDIYLYLSKILLKDMISPRFFSGFSKSSLICFALVNACSVEYANAQTARISGSATFINAGTTTVTNTGGTTTTTTNGGITTTTNTNGTTSSTIASGVITSVAAESVLPTGLYFSGNAVIVPAYSTVTNGVTSTVVSSLSVGSTTGVSNVSALSPNATFSSAAAQTLLNAAVGSVTINTNIDSVAAIIKAGAGVNGLD